MKDLQVFKNHTKYKLIVMYLASILPILLLTSLSFLVDRHSKISIEIMRYLSFIIVEIGLIIKIVYYHLILGKKGYAEKELLKINDERNIYISMRTFNLAFKIVIFTNGILWIVSSFIDETAYYVFMFELLVMVLAYIGSKIFFNKKF